jgi:ribosomal protein S6--L-glutamate ligase
LIQEFLPSSGQCARVLVVGQQIAYAVNRIANDGFHATYDHGYRARLEAFEPTREEREIAIEACRALNIDIGGVDLVRTAAGPRLLEVNHRGVRLEESAVHGPDAIDFVAGYLCARSRSARS